MQWHACYLELFYWVCHKCCLIHLTRFRLILLIFRNVALCCCCLWCGWRWWQWQFHVYKHKQWLQHQQSTHTKNKISHARAHTHSQIAAKTYLITKLWIFLCVLNKVVAAARLNEPAKWRSFQQHYMVDLVSNLCVYFYWKKKYTMRFFRPKLFSLDALRTRSTSVSMNTQPGINEWCGACNMFCFYNKMDFLFVWQNERWKNMNTNMQPTDRTTNQPANRQTDRPTDER